MLNERLSFVEGSRAILGLLSRAGLSDDDPDYALFVAIESETNDVPLGSARQHWNAAALKEFDEAEEYAKREGRVGAERLLQRFGTDL